MTFQRNSSDDLDPFSEKLHQLQNFFFKERSNNLKLKKGFEKVKVSIDSFTRLQKASKFISQKTQKVIFGLKNGHKYCSRHLHILLKNFDLFRLYWWALSSSPPLGEYATEWEVLCKVNFRINPEIDKIIPST